MDPKSIKEVSKDETIVTAALCSFLNNVILHTHAKVEWAELREAFSCQDATGKGFEARIDANMRIKGQRKTIAIAEVKPCTRNAKLGPIRMQETAQMAAWICEYPPQFDGSDNAWYGLRTA